jgi:hypothetical protein
MGPCSIFSPNSEKISESELPIGKFAFFLLFLHRIVMLCFMLAKNLSLKIMDNNRGKDTNKIVKSVE